MTNTARHVTLGAVLGLLSTGAVGMGGERRTWGPGRAGACSVWAKRGQKGRRRWLSAWARLEMMNWELWLCRTGASPAKGR